MGKKMCTSCFVAKDIETGFYKHPAMGDGYLNKCKECVKKRVTQHRNENIDRIREYDTKRFRENPERKKQNSANAIKYREKNPEKYVATNAVNNAIRDGRIKKQPCQVCNEKAHAHHEDYSKPLEVIWLCAKHHAEIHKRKRMNDLR